MAGCKHSKYHVGPISKQSSPIIQHAQKNIIHSRKRFPMLILTESGTDTGLNNASTSLLVPLSAAGEQRFNTPQKSMGLSRKENPFLMIYELEPYKKVIGSLVIHQQVGIELRCKNMFV